MIAKIIQIILLVSLFAVPVAAQGDQQLVTVILKDGSILKGQLISYELGKALSIKRTNGLVFNINWTELERLDFDNLTSGPQSKPAKDRTVKGPKHVPGKGFYNQATLNLLFGAEYVPGIPARGGGLEYGFGYSFNRFVNVGAMVGFQSHNDVFTIPINAHYRMYFLNKSFSPYVQLQGGYAFGPPLTSSFTLNIGGPTYGGSIGFRTASKYKTHFTFDIGYQITHNRTMQENWWDGSASYYERIFIRNNVRVGIVF